jgi:uncharacterized protein (DUF924 family)
VKASGEPAPEPAAVRQTPADAGHQEVLAFWFDELQPAQWWRKDEAFDRLVRERFGELHAAAVRCELFGWRLSPRGRLAEIIVLDQFSRNMFRDTPRAFAHDAQALTLAQEAVAAGADRALAPMERSFLYMPYMHSESLRIHEVATVLFAENGIEDNIEFERRHRDVIARFGRYPHRNAILGRASSAEESAFLKQPGSGF